METIFIVIGIAVFFAALAFVLFCALLVLVSHQLLGAKLDNSVLALEVRNKDHLNWLLQFLKIQLPAAPVVTPAPVPVPAPAPAPTPAPTATAAPV